MTVGTLPSFVGRSGLSEHDLSVLWEQVKGRFPVAYQALTGPIVSQMDFEDFGRLQGALYVVVHEKYPSAPIYPHRHHICADMLHARAWQRIRAMIQRGRIDDDQDYWVARNSPLAFPKQLSAAHLDRLQQLVLEHDGAR